MVDEVMSAWKGQEGKYSAHGAPHVTKIARKPEGVGAELKAAADGETNIMLSLDIMEGKERQRVKSIPMWEVKVQQYVYDSARTIFRQDE